MEKNIASSDVSDMMVYEGMLAQSRRFQFKQSFAPLRRAIDVLYAKIEHTFTRSKHTSHAHAYEFEESDLGTTATAIYSITVACVLISFFWLALLLSPAV